MDNSSCSNDLEEQWTMAKNNAQPRFFAGVPKSNLKNKNKMPVYLCFLQHILYSLSDTGKAAVIVPAGFLTTPFKIETTIRKELTEKQWLDGVITLPTNAFSRTGVSTAILIIDKAKTDSDIFFANATQLGQKNKEFGNIDLADEDINNVVDSYVNKQPIPEISCFVNVSEIPLPTYSLAPQQYFHSDHQPAAQQIDYRTLLEKQLIALDDILSEKQMLKEHLKKAIVDLMSYEN